MCSLTELWTCKGSDKWADVGNLCDIKHNQIKGADLHRCGCETDEARGVPSNPKTALPELTAINKGASQPLKPSQTQAWVTPLHGYPHIMTKRGQLIVVTSDWTLI